MRGPGGLHPRVLAPKSTKVTAREIGSPLIAKTKINEIRQCTARRTSNVEHPAAEASGLTIRSGNETLNHMVEHHNDPEHLDHLFHALANRTRREIVGLLAKRPHHISELVPRFDMSLAAVSKHVQSLERAGLVDREIVGRNHVCRLNADALSEAFEWLSAYESFWGERLSALEDVLSEVEGGKGGGAKQK